MKPSKNSNRINEFTTKSDLRSMVGTEVTLNIKNKKIKVVVTELGGNTITLMRTGDGNTSTIKIDQFLKLVNQ